MSKINVCISNSGGLQKRLFVFRRTTKALLPLGLFNGTHYFHLESLSAAQTRLLHGEHFSGLLSKIILGKFGEDTLQGFIQMNQALKMRAEAMVAA